MYDIILHILNILLYMLHGGLILFNVFGWLFKRTRIWNLLTLLATAGSWFILGIWKGWGYCPFTDWHWSVRTALGLPNETSSYIDFLIIQLFDISLQPLVVEIGTLVVFLACIAASIWVNIKKINILA